MTNMKGAGDLVKRITEVTGIDRAVKAIVGEDCGCDERQEILNKWFPFPQTSRIPEDKQEAHAWALTFITELHWRMSNRGHVKNHDWNLLWDLYREHINPRAKNKKCTQCMRDAITELKRVLEKPIKEAEAHKPPPTLPKKTPKASAKKSTPRKKPAKKTTTRKTQPRSKK